MTQCPLCRSPEPADWCWDNEMDCPLGKSLRYVNTDRLVDEIRALRTRVARLEAGEPAGDGVSQQPAPGAES